MAAIGLIILVCAIMGLPVEETGCISGRYWRRGEQKFEYSVTLEPGGVTVEADSNGVYCFPGLSPGYYSVSLYPDSVEVVAGETTFADYANNSGYDSWEEFIENYQYELFFRIDSTEDFSTNGFIISGLLTSRRIQYNSFSIEDNTKISAGVTDFFRVHYLTKGLESFIVPSACHAV